jgi:adenine-specific DNA-methyltransferase
VDKKIEDYSKEELLGVIEDLRRRKKFGLVWEYKIENVVKQCETELPVIQEVAGRAVIARDDSPDNFIIEGDNYHSLSVLNYTHTEKVDLVYIDPPYNTGSTDWKYNNDYVDKNDAYRHSKWLSLMANRLMLTRSLLKEDGVLICAIDDNEHAHLCCLLEELFPRHEIHSITIVHNPRGVQGKNFSYTHEYAVFVIPQGVKSIGNRKIQPGEVSWRNLRDNGGESLRTDARNCFYPIIVKGDNVVGFGEIPDAAFHPSKANEEQKDGTTLIYPIDPQSIERKWRYARQSVEKIKDLLRVKNSNGILQIEIGKNFGSYRSVWVDSKYDANEYGTKLIKKILPSCDFDFPKSLYNVYDCIYSVMAQRPNGIVLDYFAGSGTTGHAVLELNNEDGGNRQFILCTNNENRIAEDITFPRIKNVIKGYADVAGIPANLRYFKTAFVSKKQSDDQTRAELVARSTDMICLREGAFKKVLTTPSYKVYSGLNSLCGIVFDPDKIKDFKESVSELNIQKPLHIYVFSLSNDTFDSDFIDLEVPHELRPIPESILEVYRRIFGMRSINE